MCVCIYILYVYVLYRYKEVEMIEIENKRKDERFPLRNWKCDGERQLESKGILLAEFILAE